MNLKELFCFITLFITLVGLPAGNIWADEDSKYFDAVRTFANNVLKYGRDTYGPKQTPLFVDGLNIHTHEPVMWINPGGYKWVISNFASQQTLMRTLDGLSIITGDPKYREAAMQTIKYAFENLQAPNGLLYWGNIAAYDASDDRAYGDTHSFKLHYPYYELMWQANPNATKRFIEAFWSSHILDWSNLDMNRYSQIGGSLVEPWNYEYKGGPAIFKGKGIAFLTTGSSLCYAGTILYKLSDQEQALDWSRLLAKRYVDTRHPKTGISAFVYNSPRNSLGEDMKEHFSDPRTSVFPFEPFESTRGISNPDNTQVRPWISLFLIGDMLGEEGKDFTQWALEEFTAWGNIAYREKDNVFIPLLTDGTSIEGYVFRGTIQKGIIAKPFFVDLPFFWGYAVAYRTTSDEFMWQMVRNIAFGNKFGDIGEASNHITPKLRTDTNCSDVYGLLGFLELYRKTKRPEFLEIAQHIGDNIVDNQFYKGFFVPSKKHIYTRFDCFEPLALLHLHAAIRSTTGSMPAVWPNSSLFVAPYRYKQQGDDRRYIYTLVGSTAEPPLSLQEAAAIGDVNMVNSLLEKGIEVDSYDDALMATALMRAVQNGHREVVALLIAKGAGLESKGDWRLETPLHYVAERGHKTILELLLVKGADINATNSYGDTPLQYAAFYDRKDTIQLLLEKGATIATMHLAAYMGDLAKLEAFIQEGKDINAWDGHGYSPLHYAVKNGQKQAVELLLSKGADVNVKNWDGQTPLFYAVAAGNKDVVELLISKGADVNVKNNNGQTPLDLALSQDRKDIVELLLSKGADINATDSSGDTFLHRTLRADNPDKDTIELLISKGADINADQVKSTLAKGADVNVKTKEGQTPLQYAVLKGDKGMVELMLASGANIDSRDNAERTPLHYAAGAGGAIAIEEQVDIVDLLLNRGADINATDKLGWTPLHYAAYRFRKSTVELLIRRGANVNIEDKRGRTPFLIIKGRPTEFRGLQDAEINLKKIRELTDIMRGDGHVYYVSPSGNDFSSGLLQHPFRTISAAVSFVEPGDTIFLRGGTYHCLSSILIDKSGEQNKPIRLIAYYGENPILDFSEVSGGGVFVAGAYWHIKGLTVTNVYGWGIRLVGEGVHHNILEQITSRSNSASGIVLMNGPAHNLIINCDSFRNFDPQYNGESGDGFAVARNVGKGNILIGCRAWNNSDDGFDLWYANESVRLENCYAFRNGDNIWGHPIFTGNANGFKLGQMGGAHILIYCAAWNQQRAGFDVNGNSTGVTLYNCTGVRNKINFAFMYAGGNPAKHILRNNLSYGGSVEMRPMIDDRSNSWNVPLDARVTETDFLNLDDSVILELRNPDGSIPESDFLKLAPDSNVIDKGQDVGLPFVGKAPDLGAFEYLPGDTEKRSDDALHEAARNHDIQQIRKLLSRGADINAKDWLGYTPLHWAGYFGYADVAEIFISEGANPNMQSDTGRFVLGIAVERGFGEVARLIVVSGANINTRDINGATPLDCAIENGYKEIVELLICKGADVNTTNAAGDTPLHYMVNYPSADKKIIELLITKGANINAKNSKGQTPFDIALSQNRRDIVELLLSKGADVSIHTAVSFGNLDKVRSCLEKGINVNARDENSATPLHLVTNKDMAELLISKGADVNAKDKNDYTPLHSAAKEGRQDVAEALITKGADINAKDKSEHTPLYYAVLGKDKEIIKLLVAKGADVNFAPKDGYPPLCYAVWFEDKEMVELLVAHGAKFDVKDQDGWTAFRYAAAQGNRELVELFVSKGADVSTLHMAACIGDLSHVRSLLEQGTNVDTKDELGWTPLYWAASTGRTEVAELLIAKGADIQAKTNDEETPLHQASASGSEEVAKLLISKNADVNAKDKYGTTPLHNGVSSGNRVIVELLLAKGASTNVQNRNKWTPLHFAVTRGKKEIVEVLLAKGADINAKDTLDQTPLQLGENQNRTEILELLRKHGAK